MICLEPSKCIWHGITMTLGPILISFRKSRSNTQHTYSSPAGSKRVTDRLWKTSLTQCSPDISAMEPEVRLALDNVVANVSVGESGVGEAGGDVTQGGTLLSRELVGELGSRSRSYDLLFTGVRVNASVASLRAIMRRSCAASRSLMSIRRSSICLWDIGRLLLYQYRVCQMVHLLTFA